MLELKAKIRENNDKKLNDLRKEGILPAVIYGYKQKNEAVELSYKEFEKVFKEAGESALIQLKIGDGAKKTVLIHEIQTEPISGKFIHADFYAIREDQPLKIRIPLLFIGDKDAPAVRDLGGYLGRYVQELEIEALPKDLPKELEVNVSSLATFDDKIFVKDIVLPANVKILANPDEVIAAAEAPISEEKLKEELETKPEEKIDEVKVIEKEKKKEEEGEEAAEPKDKEAK